MMAKPDLAVIGAGPAGVHAGMAASSCGLDVLLLDEAAAAGGQIYRASLDGSQGRGFQDAKGDALRHALGDSAVVTLPGHRVWTVSTRPIGVAVTGPSSVKTIHPRALLVAAGATERVVPFPGWTLPGVIGLAAATVLLKSPGPLPPGPIVVAGRGPLLAAVAAGLLARGSKVACVVDGASRADWIRTTPALLSRPDLLARGALWLRRIKQAGVPILHGYVVDKAFGTGSLDSVRVAKVDRNGNPRNGRTRTVEARLLAIGQGLVPATELLALFGVPFQHSAPDATWLPRVDRDGRTPVPGLYAAGDGTGICGVLAAELAGRLAGLAVAHDLGALSAQDHAKQTAPLHHRLRRATGAGRAMAQVMTPGAGQFARIPPDTIVCRCEDVTRAEIDAVFAAGATGLDALKTRTRCGMGPCQGRVCGSAVAALASLHPQVASPPRPWTVRPPVRPVPIADLVGEFGYDEVPSVIPAI